MAMQITPKMAIMSHLSDAQELVDMNCSKTSINSQINIAKAILMEFSSDIDSYVDESAIDAAIEKHARR
jgi:hypothetical protein